MDGKSVYEVQWDWVSHRLGAGLIRRAYIGV